MLIPAVFLMLIGFCALMFAVQTLPSGDPAYLALVFGLLAAYAGVSVVAEQRNSRRFEAWLIANRKAVESFGAEYNGQTINNRTELKVFYLAFAVVVFAFKLPSRYVPADAVCRPASVLRAAVYSAASLLCGWWSFPSGPIFTLDALIWNLQGGRSFHVWQIYETLDNADARDRERKRLRRRPFLSRELTGTEKLALGIIVFLSAVLLSNYL